MVEQLQLDRFELVYLRMQYRLYAIDQVWLVWELVELDCSNQRCSNRVTKKKDIGKSFYRQDIEPTH